MSLLLRVAALAVAPSLIFIGTAAAQPEPVGGAPLGAVGQPVVGAADVLELPEVEAAAWLVADIDSGEILAALNAHTALPPASTIKLLTALAVMPMIDPDVSYVATEDAARVDGSRVGLVPDESYTLTDLQHGLLLASGNDTAHALAELTGGQRAAVELMKAEAVRLGAFDTQVATPHGLHEPDQVSSAYDLALIARAILQDESLAALVRTRTYDFPGLDGETFQIQNHNRLLGRYEGTIGLKTGYTEESGHTLVAAAERDVRLVVTILGAEGRAEPIAEALLDWGFAVAGTAEPVGVLVTPEEAATIRAEREHAAAAPGPAGGGAPPDSEDTDNDDEAAVPSGVDALPWLWAAAGIVPLVGLIVLWGRRRGRREGGRYAG